MDRAFYTSRALLARWREREADAEIYMHVLPAMVFGENNRAYKSSGETLRAIYINRKPNLIVAFGDAALDLVVSLKRTVFPGVPIVSIEVTSSKIEQYEAETDLYQLAAPDFIKSNYALAYALFPKRKRAVFLIQEDAFVNTAEFYSNELGRLYPDSQFEFLTNHDPISADPILRADPKDTVLLVFCPGWEYPEGRPLLGEAFIRDLSNRYGLPVFVCLRDYLGSGIVGGAGFTGSSWGRAAAELGISILLDKKDAAAVSTSAALENTFVDYAALKRFGVPLPLVPEGAEIINLPPSSWDRYSVYLQALGVFLLVALAVLSTLMLRRRRERSRLLLAKAELERQVEDRTMDLQATNDRLSVTNESLVEAVSRAEVLRENVLRTEREVVLGRMAAGLEHSLNSPLSAIRSAKESVKEALTEDGEGLTRLLSGFTENQRRLFLEYVVQIPELAEKTECSRDQLFGNLEERLRNLGCAHAEKVAGALEELGLSDLPGKELRVFAEEGAEAVAEALFRCVVIERSFWIIESAVEKSSAVLKIIREYNTGPQDTAARFPVEIQSTLEKSLKVMRNFIPNSIEIVTNYGDVPKVLASESRLLRLWGHLIDNAMQAMPEGGRLRIETTREQGMAIVRIEDDGVGIPDAIRETLFDPFVTSRPLAEGMGLGLAYCKKLVEELSGSIGFASKAKGTVFTVRIPVSEST